MRVRDQGGGIVCSVPPVTDSPIKVLRIIARLNVGGPSIQVVSLTRRLEPLGYRTVLLRGFESPDEGSMDYLACEMGVRPIRVPGLRREIGLHDLRALWETMRWIRRFRPKVMHTHTAKAGTIGRLAAILTPGWTPPVVVHTFHGHVLRGEFSARGSKLAALVERSLARHADRLIAVSDEIKDDLVDFGVAPPEQIEVVHLGFDLSPFTDNTPRREAVRRATRERLGIPLDARVVTVIARVVKVKRIDRFLAMARELADLEDVWFLVAGDGNLRAELAQSNDAKALGHRLVWAGFERDVPGICFASDVVALTSDNEGTPVCLIEAQAAGLPVVSTQVGGARTVVLDGATGRIVSQDAEAIAAAVRSLLENADLRATYGHRGRSHVLATFSVERLVADIARLYGQLLNEKAPT